MKHRYVNKYTAVVIEGNLSHWTGPNPDKDPDSKARALALAKKYREQGKTAYAVVVEQILDEHDD